MQQSTPKTYNHITFQAGCGIDIHSDVTMEPIRFTDSVTFWSHGDGPVCNERPTTVTLRWDDVSRASFFLFGWVQKYGTGYKGMLDGMCAVTSELRPDSYPGCASCPSCSLCFVFVAELLIQAHREPVCSWEDTRSLHSKTMRRNTTLGHSVLLQNVPLHTTNGNR